MWYDVTPGFNFESLLTGINLFSQLNESLISDMFCSLDAVHRVVSGVQEDVRDMIDLVSSMYSVTVYLSKHTCSIYPNLVNFGYSALTFNNSSVKS